MGLFGLGKKPGLGIDIASTAVKAVELVANGDSYDITHVAETPLGKGIMAGNEVKDIDKLGKAIALLRKRMGSAREAVIAVSGNDAITKQVNMSVDLDDEGIAEQIETDAESLVTINVNEMLYDFESLGEHPTIPGQQLVTITATRTTTVDSRVQAVEAAGYKVPIVDVDTQVLARACAHLLPHMHPDIVENPLPYLVLDISSFATQVTAIKNGEVAFNRFQSGGLNQLFKALDENGSIDHGEIMAKLRSGEVDEFPALIIEDFLEDLATQISRSVQMYQSNATDKGFSAIFMINSGAMIPLITAAACEQTEFPVHVLNPFEHFVLPSKCSHLQSHGPRFVEAIGLALRSFVPWHT